MRTVLCSMYMYMYTYVYHVWVCEDTQGIVHRVVSRCHLLVACHSVTQVIVITCPRGLYQIYYTRPSGHVITCLLS